MVVVLRMMTTNFIFMMMMMIIVLQVTTVTKFVHVVVDADVSQKKFHFDVYDLPAIQWACEPFLELKYIEQLHPMQETTRDICLKLRAGKLGKGNNNNNNNNKINNGNNDVIETEDNVTELHTVTGDDEEEEEEDKDEEEKSSSPTHSTITETEEEEEENETTDEIITDQLNVIEEGDKSELLLKDDETTEETSASRSISENYKFSVLQKNDGHESDPDGIPNRYMLMQGDKRDLAKIALEKTVKWRQEHEIDTILGRPHPKFDVSKKVFPHYFCGRDDTNHVILLQRPGLMNINLAHKNGLSGEELLFHYVYVMEYLWRIIDPAPNATMTSIIDLTEMNISILRKREQLRIGSLFLSTMDAHFPQRSHRTLLINAPKWFGALYKIASPLLRESTKQKIQILSKGKEQDMILQHLLSECPIPDGTKHENIPPGIMEEELRNFVSYCLLVRKQRSGVINGRRK
ncbi:MAG: hypothetical protein ACI90V_006178 [Bacillariaceae sp.]|jgi:hypothetical protein